MKNLLTNKLAVVGMAVGVTIGGTMAYAYWSADGSGSGGAQAITAQSLTVAASSGTADLYPGFTGGDLFFTVSNPNPYPVSFTSMSPGTVTSSDQANCPASNVTVASATGLSIGAAANASNVARSIADVVSLSSTAPSACQGVTFTVELTLTGTSV